MPPGHSVEKFRFETTAVDSQGCTLSTVACSFLRTRLNDRMGLSAAMGDVETVRAGLLVSSNSREWEHEHLWVAM